ncbi:Low-density lipoprotein receptor repeat class B [Nesidiocoris tenuis]|uniref:Sortilin-related receptor n=1 Tax=Nesidiocoris tenuis TaxID=355587 RepID=A0ABN7BDM8_9HEMI|nr:Low-density lipoprotein receptor repeat class B [Nesidiocoris tenuis]
MTVDKWFLLWMNSVLLFAICRADLTVEKIDDETNSLVLTRTETDDGVKFVPEAHSVQKREAFAQANITSYVTRLNSSHHKLNVHWSGTSSQVLICLAQTSRPLGIHQKPLPSSLYISYDYGKTFENKTDFFKLSNDSYASPDKCFFPKNAESFIIIMDKFNKKLFTSKDHGRNINKIDLNFTPVDVLPHPNDPLTFLVHDSENNLRITEDFGENFVILQESVKSYVWTNKTNGPQDPLSVALIVQRLEPHTMTAIMLTNIKSNRFSLKPMLGNVEKISSHGDFVFALRKTGNETRQLFISYQGGEFRPTQFDSAMTPRNFHVVDTSDARLMVAVTYTETLSNLYISEFESASEKYYFRLSLERLFVFLPNVTWLDSWISPFDEPAFADIYRVKGMRGIYLASQISPYTDSKNPLPDNIVSLITFDWGGIWKPLEPPKVNINGQPVRCELKKNCSLHVTQKFSMLYPATRNTPILSSDSAPGIIMATGTVGSSLKGHNGVYISRDAGLSWHHVLRENYIFNIGDHGGILTAVRMFKSAGETFQVLYSFDEGVSWEAFNFADSPMRIYGLMTEPGENTTVFTLFGSKPESHEWTIINIDFQNAFQRNCTADDYKMWSPASSQSVKMACIMGRKETYERRFITSKCFNGLNFNRTVKYEPCFCDIEDFECDYGFVRHVSSPVCGRNFSPEYDPYKIPFSCQPGQFYERTRGYRKIDGDACIGGNEADYMPELIPCPTEEPSYFLLLAQKEHIIRFDVLNPKPQVLPVRNLNNVISIDYDIENNCVYFADIVDDVIGRQCFASGNRSVEYLVTSNLRSVEGIAFDWVSRSLYFVDGVRAKIELIRTDIDHSGRMRMTILDSKAVKKPRGIALHPVKGYMFWTDWDKENPTVNRANMDGSDIRILAKSPRVHWPNGITIDHFGGHIYWADARLDYIATTDLEGRFFRIVASNKEIPSMKHPFSVAVFKDILYWDDWSQREIFMINKNDGSELGNIQTSYVGLMDVKVFGHSIQGGTNKCDSKVGQLCSHVCLALPDNKYRCACPDGMHIYKGECVCANDNQKPGVNDTCKPVSPHGCVASQLTCTNGNCVPLVWQCDGDDDCGDNSDESQCPSRCNASAFDCGNGKCIPMSWKCDHETDCNDGRDEKDCPKAKCLPTQFQCDNGNCISRRWICDMENDCKDGSDERNCPTRAPPTPPTNSTSCSAGQFSCKTGGVMACIPNFWVCDGESDCMDDLDEKDCDKKMCNQPSVQFKCEISHRCIMKAYVCDGSLDCGVGDDSDERNCTKPNAPSENNPPTYNSTCKGFMFKCSNKICVPDWWKCDGVDDCGDNSDEEGCVIPPTLPIPTILPTPARERKCRMDEFRCDSGACIAQQWVCDSEKDCPNGEDEKHCDYGTHEEECPPRFYKCKKSRTCLPAYQVCDGIKHCPDGSDEIFCNSIPKGPENPVCAAGFFACDGSRCLPFAQYCDNHYNCYDGTDEDNCTSDPLAHIFQVSQLEVDRYTISSSSITLLWWVGAVSPNITLQFMPSIAEMLENGQQSWKNTSWISDHRYTFDKLLPYTRHNITVYVKLLSTNEVFPPGQYVTATTAPDEPSAPLNVNVTQKRPTLIEVKWSPPLKPNGVIRRYEVFIKPPMPPDRVVVAGNTQVSLPGHFTHGVTYSVWVNAVNEVGSKSSNLVTFTADNASSIGMVEEFHSENVRSTGMTWKWKAVKDAQGYNLRVSANYPYAELPPVTTNDTRYTFSNLAPGVYYTFSISAFNKQFEGQSLTKGVQTPGAELPIVPDLKAQVSEQSQSTVLLSWNPPKKTMYNENWRYGIYYSVNSSDFFKEPRNITSNTHLLLTGLGACEKYMIDIGVVAPLGQGPLSAAPTTITTGNDPRAPPKRLTAVADRHNDTLVDITWSSSCFKMSEAVGYILTIKDVVIDKTSSITFLPTNKTELKHRVAVHQGASYKIVVQTDREGSWPSEPLIYHAPQLPSPHQIEAHSHADEQDTHIDLFWNLPLEKTNPADLPPYKYEILVSEGKPLESNEYKIVVADSSPYSFKDAKAGRLYYFAVRLVTEKGHRSPISETATEELPLGAWASVMTPTRVIGIFVPVLLVMMLVGGAFVVFIVRHRRLQNSFTSFANSHYSTRSGNATFTADGLDDEDSPVIRGFSDDEPLVVA